MGESCFLEKEGLSEISFNWKKCGSERNEKKGSLIRNRYWDGIGPLAVGQQRGWPGNTINLVKCVAYKSSPIREETETSGCEFLTPYHSSIKFWSQHWILEVMFSLNVFPQKK